MTRDENRKFVILQGRRSGLDDLLAPLIDEYSYNAMLELAELRIPFYERMLRYAGSDSDYSTSNVKVDYTDSFSSDFTSLSISDLESTISPDGIHFIVRMYLNGLPIEQVLPIGVNEPSNRRAFSLTNSGDMSFNFSVSTSDYLDVKFILKPKRPTSGSDVYLLPANAEYYVSFAALRDAFFDKGDAKMAAIYQARKDAIENRILRGFVGSTSFRVKPVEF